MIRDRPSVLIVDDEVDTCRNLFDIFSDLGYRVDIAHEGPIALEKVRTAHYDVALLDLMMPGMASHARTVLITGHRKELAPSVECLLAAGADAVCYKPFNLAELFATVERLSRP